MNRVLLIVGGLLTFLLTAFKIAMPYLFQWKEAMDSSPASLWSTLYAENLGISLLLLFFGYMSVFQHGEFLRSALGKTVLLCVGSLWVFRSVAEVVLFKVGQDGAWWRVLLFVALALMYLVPFATAGRTPRADRREGRNPSARSHDQGSQDPAHLVCLHVAGGFSLRRPTAMPAGLVRGSLGARLPQFGLCIPRFRAHYPRGSG